jgi:DNA-binding GntR family transcriptional regulator
MVDNPVMSKMMRELASLTCLIIVLYDSPTVPACTHDDHGHIIDAISEGRTEDAIATMLEHLHHIESVLDMSTPQGEDDDLEALLGMG